MKRSKSLLFLAFMLFAGLSCQPELDPFPVNITSPNADYVFAGDPGDCAGIGVNGNYVEGEIMDSSNFISVKVNVLKTGSYTISTPVVNGYSFKQTGVFSITGLNEIMIYASGKPLVPGPDQFELNGDSSSCNFSISVQKSGNTDHFPLTQNSYWNYDDLLHPGDTISRMIIDSIPLGTAYYKRLKEKYIDGSSKIYFIRKKSFCRLEFAE